jgi:AraC-like DNA-binding protein
MEDERAKLGASASTCYKVFVPRLTGAFKEDVNRSRRHLKQLNIEMNWANVVELALDYRLEDSNNKRPAHK